MSTDILYKDGTLYKVDFLPSSKRWYNIESKIPLKQTM